MNHPRHEVLRTDTAASATHIDTFVTAIETHMSRWTALLTATANRCSLNEVHREDSDTDVKTR